MNASPLATPAPMPPPGHTGPTTPVGTHTGHTAGDSPGSDGTQARRGFIGDVSLGYHNARGISDSRVYPEYITKKLMTKNTDCAGVGESNWKARDLARASGQIGRA